ncbi:MAG: UvrD-helicase domain-containing protein [Desulfamplus sp.]|nr:UvrD-helicase domain-containing protein [Desulfamplus sp.]
MEFIADLHIHSHFSRATAKNLDLEHICKSAMLKGITVVGTGDFTHPGWFQELEENLEPAEDGLFRLKEDGLFKLETELKTELNAAFTTELKPKIETDFCRNNVRFILQCEISSIYKKDGRVRKNHNLIYFPDMASVKAFNEKLGRIGNITSDGRPILGLDCEKLLEIVLETSEDGFMIPAHIWTPWFSMFGSKSGFDSVEECFGSLAHHIFAVETGLSSDLPMNWRIENLDKMSFISCSDAHSPMFMGRNASCFNTSLSYSGIKDALKNSSSNGSYLGTIDMHPAEGKYHYDGHRKCNICFNPSETVRHEGICPVCDKPLTLGVLYRVQELASRPEGYIPENRHRYQTIIPLAELLSEICGTGTKTKKVDAYYRKALASLGSELDILLKKDLDEIDRAGIPLLAEAVKRMRSNKIFVTPGFDGEFGRVTVFAPEEKDRLRGDISIFPVPLAATIHVAEAATIPPPTIAPLAAKIPIPPIATVPLAAKQSKNNGVNKETREQVSDRKTAGCLNQQQQQALNSKNRPLLMEAGPGTGKTRTLTEKIASLVINDDVKPQSILALTFTTKAAEEMRHRVEKLLCQCSELKQPCFNSYNADIPIQQENAKQIFVSTFHGFCLMVLKEYTDHKFLISDDTLRKALIKKSIKLAFPDNIREISSSKMEHAIAMLKQGNALYSDISDKLSDSSISNLISDSKKYEMTMQVLLKYQELLSCYQLVDFEDLMNMVLKLLQNDDTQQNDGAMSHDSAKPNYGAKSEVLSRLKKRFEYIFVDEYQDINKGQYQLIKLMAGDGRNLCVIGDPDQAIYGFRGADNRYFKRFKHDYPDTEKIVFKRNYRSTETILEVSFQLINSNKSQCPMDDDVQCSMSQDVQYSISDDVQYSVSEDVECSIPKDLQCSQCSTSEVYAPKFSQMQLSKKEKLFSGIHGEQQIHILDAASEDAQAVMIGKTIEHLVGGLSMFSMDAGKADATLQNEYSFADVAVLYRTKKQSAVLTKVFEKAGIPFQTADKDNIFLQSGIKELISCFRILLDKGTFYDFEVMFSYLESAKGKQAREKLNISKKKLNISKKKLNISKKKLNISKKDTIESKEPPVKLMDFCNSIKGESTSEILNKIMVELAIDKVIMNNKKSMETLRLLVKEAKKYLDPVVYYENIAMKKDIDTVEYQAEKVSLMTMHAAKGLEFKVVFIAGCENGLIPFYNHGGKCENFEEERRLFYVAITRAEELLYLCYAKKRQIYGQIVAMEKSLFLHDIEENLKNYSRAKSRKTKKSNFTEQLDLFSKI